ncbi:MAG: hypothetical protein ACK6A8_18285 [Planctomycetota bacterium]
MELRTVYIPAFFQCERVRDCQIPLRRYVLRDFKFNCSVTIRSVIEEVENEQITPSSNLLMCVLGLFRRLSDFQQRT